MDEIPPEEEEEIARRHLNLNLWIVKSKRHGLEVSPANNHIKTKFMVVSIKVKSSIVSHLLIHCKSHPTTCQRMIVFSKLIAKLLVFGIHLWIKIPALGISMTTKLK